MRSAFTAELEQLRIQVEVMGLKVDDAIRGAGEVLLSGDPNLAERIVREDDDIDAMLVSLTQRCYDLLCRQSPMAADLRLVVSVLRIVSDLERIGDLCLRVVKLAPEHALLTSQPEAFGMLRSMADEAGTLFRTALRAWSTQDARLALSLEELDDAMDGYNSDLMRVLTGLEGPRAVEAAIATLLAGRSLERIADHSVMIGERIRYLLTGNTESLSKEVGP